MDGHLTHCSNRASTYVSIAAPMVSVLATQIMNSMIQKKSTRGLCVT